MNNNTFTKSDVISSIIIGEIVAWLLIAIANNLGISLPFVWVLPIILPILCVGGLYVAYMIGKKIPVIYQIAKFVLVGGFNTLVDWGVLALMIYIFRSYLAIEPQDVLISAAVITLVYYTLFKAISFVVAATNSYLWNKFWTFKRESTEGMGKEFFQFLTITVIGFVVNVAIASAVFKYISPFGGLNLDQWGIIAAVIATTFSMVWNFVGYKFIVFDAKSNPEPQIAPE